MKTRIVLLAVLLAGCAAAPGKVSTKGAAPPDWQALANQATAAFNVGPAYVDERESAPNGLYVCREMRIQLRTTLGVTRVRRILAHELGHHIRRHCGAGAAQEMEANAVAVSVLEVWGATRDQAVQAIANMLYTNRHVTWNSVHDTCGELRDFLSRFPETPDPRASGECEK